MPDLPLTQLDYLSWLFLQIVSACYPQLLGFNSFCSIQIDSVDSELKSSSCGYQPMTSGRKIQKDSQI